MRILQIGGISGLLAIIVPLTDMLISQDFRCLSPLSEGDVFTATLGFHFAASFAASVYGGKVAKWRIPDDVVFVDELPRTTGKLLELKLREHFRDHILRSARKS